MYKHRKQHDCANSHDTQIFDQSVVDPIARDPLLDDQALLVDTPDGWVVMLGCAHAGVINTLDYIAAITGAAKFHGVLGGMHLMHASVDRIQATLACLRRYDVQVIGANHCTGPRALGVLWHDVCDRCVDCRTGTRLLFG